MAGIQPINSAKCGKQKVGPRKPPCEYLPLELMGIQKPDDGATSSLRSQSEEVGKGFFKETEC